MKLSKIEKVETRGNTAHVYLDDGTELSGVIEISTKSALNYLSEVTIRAYVSVSKQRTYIHKSTGDKVSLKATDIDDFFRNRNPLDYYEQVND